MLKGLIREMFSISKRFVSFKNLFIMEILSLLPLCLWFLAGYFFFHTPLPELTDFLSVKVFTAIVFIFLIILCIFSITRKRVGLFFIGMGLLFVGFNLFVNMFFYFRGFIYLGEGEVFEKRYVDIVKGTFSKPPVLPISVKEIQKERMFILLDLKEYEVKKGSSIKYGSFRITLQEIGDAPVLTLYDNKDQEIESAFFMITKSDSNFFQFHNLPHQFYLKPLNEDTYSLRIIRSKLTIFKGVVAKGDKINFEEFYMNIKDGSKWVLLKIERKNNYYLFFGGLCLIITGIFIERKKNVKIDNRSV